MAWWSWSSVWNSTFLRRGVPFYHRLAFRHRGVFLLCVAFFHIFDCFLASIILGLVFGFHSRSSTGPFFPIKIRAHRTGSRAHPVVGGPGAELALLLSGSGCGRIEVNGLRG